LSGGIASVVAGHIVTIGADGKLHGFNTIGYVVTATSLLALALVWRLNRSVAATAAAPQAAPAAH
jgi:hypothetical protein